YTVTVTNNGISDAAMVVVDNTTPTNLTFKSNAGDCTTAYPCSLGVVPAGATKTITTTYTVPANYTMPNPVLNTVSVSSSTTDPDVTNNSATSSISLSEPTANAGPDQMVVVSTGVTLDGSASSGNGLTYAWTQTAGTSITLSSATAVKPTFTAPA